MGKPLIQQRRGKGGTPFTAPSHLYYARVMFRTYDEKEKTSSVKGQVLEFVNDPARSGVLMVVKDETGKKLHLLAPEGIAIGDTIEFGAQAPVSIGNVLPLSAIPDGSPIYNLELTQGDGGKLVRAAGTSAYVVSHAGDVVYVTLPSKKVKVLDGRCRAQIGVVSVGGRLDRPVFTAGKKFHMMKAKAAYWPKPRGVAMSAYDHPFGGKQHHPGRSTIVKRTAPPGQKVGLLGAASVGRRKGKRKGAGEQPQ